MHMNYIVGTPQVQPRHSSSCQQEKPAPVKYVYWQWATNTSTHWHTVNMHSVVYCIALLMWLTQANDIYFVPSISCRFSKTKRSRFIGIPIKGDYANME